MSELDYTGEFLLDDGTVHQQNLDEHGWATKELVDRIKLFTLVPKDPSRWNLFRIHIPEDAKPVWTWRTFGIINGPVKDQMRIYGIGYKREYESPFYMWMLPGGHVEAGTDQPLFAEALWRGR